MPSAWESRRNARHPIVLIKNQPDGSIVSLWADRQDGYAVHSHSIYALAVLVVATPCPLILATPIAIMSGMNRAAKIDLIVKCGAVIEQLGEVDVAVFDKTGTLTLGQPQLVDVLLADEEPAAAQGLLSSPTTEGARMEGERARMLLQLAASVEQFSAHILARAVVLAAPTTGNSRLRWYREAPYEAEFGRKGTGASTGAGGMEMSRETSSSLWSLRMVMG